ncbi:MAG: hypothetical protein HN350_00005 [Phycisphaerales bacterium]|jgi:chemotaxis protein MotB|nr:hypothetical protein [Phycisphaerales bacterium]
MAGKSKKTVQEEAPPGTPAWMLTFCDCMTLLLTFFVLLLSFSSFDEAKERQLYGAMKIRSDPSILDNQEKVDASLSKEVKLKDDVTEQGSEAEHDQNRDRVKNPKKLEISPEVNAYHKEMVLNLPSDAMFVGRSVKLTPSGQDMLERIALYLKLHPCHMMIGESSRSGSSAGMHRLWVVLDFFRRSEAISPSQSWISQECPRPMYSQKNKPAIQIVLLARDITRLPARR